MEIKVERVIDVLEGKYCCAMDDTGEIYTAKCAFLDTAARYECTVFSCEINFEYHKCKPCLNAKVVE